MTKAIDPLEDDEFELALLGLDYGESTVLHVGNDAWVIADSCHHVDGRPGALRYLESIGLDPVHNVALIAATHWHDDHIRGMSRLVESCPNADFCCASVLCDMEFLTWVGALEGRHFSATGPGLREIHGVLSHLVDTGKMPIHALANRVVFRRGACTISSLSPGDGIFQQFLASVGGLIPGQSENKTRIRSVSPHEVAVALWVECCESSLLLGTDLERKGWVAILGNMSRLPGKASVYKIPHHGSSNADEPAAWEHMLEDKPVAVLAP